MKTTTYSQLQFLPITVSELYFLNPNIIVYFMFNPTLLQWLFQLLKSPCPISVYWVLGSWGVLYLFPPCSIVSNFTLWSSFFLSLCLISVSWVQKPLRVLDLIPPSCNVSNVTLCSSFFLHVLVSDLRLWVQKFVACSISNPILLHGFKYCSLGSSSFLKLCLVSVARIQKSLRFLSLVPPCCIVSIVALSARASFYHFVWSPFLGPISFRFHI